MTFDDLPEQVRKAVSRLIEKIGRRGTITYSELDQALDDPEISSNELEAVLSYLLEHGINVVE